MEWTDWLLIMGAAGRRDDNLLLNGESLPPAFAHHTTFARLRGSRDLQSS